MFKGKKVELSSEELQATKNTIQLLTDKGTNLSKLHELEFIIVYGAQESIGNIKAALKNTGIVLQSLEISGKDIIIRRSMMLDFDRIVDFESTLTYIAQANGAKYDGWGGFGVK